MTFGKWVRLYQAYKDTFDMELTMKSKNVRYSDLEKETTIDDIIPF